MLTARKQTNEDEEDIRRLLMELELGDAGTPFTNFWILKKDGATIGIAQIQDHKEFAFLCRFGITRKMQGRGFGRKFLEFIMPEYKKDVFLYTVIPSFFSKMGFIVTPFDDRLPSRSSFGCEGCAPNMCRCMVRKYK